ncbi:MAG: glycoside hydrolase family 97 catalytic domain-containing protein [Chitinophaga sp.]|uniref:glycoside hydrolase family 97 protein n=1 Tax=Chitinophaga sp. TaxID=1869181 RepID=UPI001B0D1A89|nr:glycoside hydrolase family 97 protein [Chitinophaga sp.]MBO9729789.1 glycoside hydrolase family 97 catalytic domain-containing protein [Chitinophaga sp.]
MNKMFSLLKSLGIPGLTCLLLHGPLSAQKIYSITSPGNTTVLSISAPGGKPGYQLSFKGKKITGWSALDIAIDGVSLSNAKITRYDKPVRHQESIATPLGEQDTLFCIYQQAKLYLKTTAGLPVIIDFRVMDSSIAFRYTVAVADTMQHRLREFTTFSFPASPLLYQYNEESIFTPTRADTFRTTTDLPVTMESAGNYYQVGEAVNLNYTKAELARGIDGNTLMIKFPRDTAVLFHGNIKTPWRTLSVATSAIALAHCRSLNTKLADAPGPGDFSWIKPGKLIRAQLNTQSGLDCIDFAVKHHFQYIMFDAGWYGAEFRSSSDPTQVIPAIDMPKVIAYGRKHQVGVILYVNYIGLKAKLDTILPLYKQWGVAGLKFGFVDGLTQSGLTWLSQAIKKVQQYGFILNIHDNYKPTGLSSTYPALLTQEGIRGNENSPDAFHTTTLPFTRYFAGAADYTYCFPNSKYDFSKHIKVSKGQQLALSVVYYSPLQAIFWYGQPNDYTNEEEIEFYDYVPTTWNESHYLAGDIGKGIAIARRKGDTWYLGCAAGLNDWQAELKLSFLKPGVSYIVTVYEDDGNQSIRKRTMRLTSGDRVPVKLLAKGGQAFIFRPGNHE